MPTPVVVPAVPVVVATPPAAEKPLDALLAKKVLNTFTLAATEATTSEPSEPTLKQLFLKVMTHLGLMSQPSSAMAPYCCICCMHADDRKLADHPSGEGATASVDHAVVLQAA